LEGTTYSGEESYVLDLSEWSLTDQELRNSGGPRREGFDVAPTTDAIAVAFQRRRFGDLANTVAKSRFIMAPPTDTLEERLACFRNPHFLRPDLGLKHLTINYAGQLKPYCDNLAEYQTTPLVLRAPADRAANNGPDAKATATNLLTERYMLNTLQAGTYFDAGGPETFEQWLKRGPYYLFLWPKDGSNHDTRAHVTFDLPVGVKLDGTNAASNYPYRLLLFHRHRKGYGISIRNSRVTEIEEAANVAPAVMTS
jgi:hypothetical protein